MVELVWEKFKVLLDRGLDFTELEFADSYELYCVNGSIPFRCQIPKGSIVETEYTASYQANAKPYVSSNVRTAFEGTNYLLQMSSLVHENIAPGDEVDLEILIPGTFNGPNPPSNGRYIDGGEAWFTPGVSGDRVLSLSVVDKDDILGMGPGTVLGTYHDVEVPAGNQGWRLHPVYPTEVETLGWYGFIPAGMYLVMRVKRSPVATENGNFYCNLQWGIKT